MEDKLNDLMNDGDYYSAHQLILSLTKRSKFLLSKKQLILLIYLFNRKVKVGKVNEAVDFVKNGVTKLCQASQFASASDAAMSVFEYATASNFNQLKEMLSQLLESSDPQYWRTFLNEMGKEYFHYIIL